MKNIASEMNLSETAFVEKLTTGINNFKVYLFSFILFLKKNPF